MRFLFIGEASKLALTGDVVLDEAARTVTFTGWRQVGCSGRGRVRLTLITYDSYGCAVALTGGLVLDEAACAVTFTGWRRLGGTSGGWIGDCLFDVNVCGREVTWL